MPSPRTLYVLKSAYFAIPDEAKTYNISPELHINRRIFNKLIQDVFPKFHGDSRQLISEALKMLPADNLDLRSVWLAVAHCGIPLGLSSQTHSIRETAHNLATSGPFGFRKTLVLEDIYALPEYMQSRNNVPAFMDVWRQQLTKRAHVRNKKTLVLEDIYELPEYMQSRNNVPAFMDIWRQQLTKRTDFRNNSKYQIDHPFSINGTNGTHDKEVAIPNPPSTKAQAETATRYTSHMSHIRQGPQHNASKVERRQGKTPSLILALVKVFYQPMLKAQLVGVMADALLYINPLLLGRLIAYIEAKEERPEWEGYALAASFFAVVLTNSLLSSYRFYTSANIGNRVKTVLAAAVYKKTLTMNAEDRHQFTVGNMVNLMTTDCQKFRDLTTKLYALFSWPVQISIAFYLLYNVLGIAFVAGITSLIFLLPTNARLTTILQGLQTRQMALQDQRIKLVNEILNGVKVLKLYAWEPSFQKKILEARRLEVLELKKAAVFTSINYFCWVISPVLVTVTTFAAYLLITGDSLTPSKAFVTMNVIFLMKAPMDTLPTLISQIVQ
ncbi:hypothetical protein EGW08_023002, partial [Elysia chlorotica]